MSPLLLIALLFMGGGLAAGWVVALRPAGVGEVSADDYLRSLDDLDDDELDEYTAKLQEPFITRLVRPLQSGVGDGLASLTPRGQLDRLHAQILQAGLGGQVKAEEFATLQVLVVGASVVFAVILVLVSGPSTNIAACELIGLPVLGLLAPQAWLNRKVDERKDAIRGDLPDILDLLAISVEAGVGFEGAIAVVCNQFTTPLATEMQRTLKEMELGLSRRDALTNLKRRTEVPELSNFVLALIQADALGMPIGRVLKTQAVEMRNKRRAWAREKAAKLPVKIMIPLVFFIFPAILVVTMGPAMESLIVNLK